jgi:2-dehydro-3-deoxyglucarate aldolase/4-hydroxy-2-oxoheptanedioate aldolase
MPPPSPFQHALKPRLRLGHACRLLWLSLGNAALAEIAAHADPDAIVIDLQHGLWERSALEAAAGIAGARVPVIARTADFTATAIGAALDAGVAAVLAPLVESAEDARALVDAGHYPPLGRRSGGGVRPLLGGMAGMRAADTQVAIGAMLETARGVDHADAICAVEGLDFIFIGTGDLALGFAAASVGELQAICARLRDIAHRHHLPCGIFTPDAPAARQALADGYEMVVVANDIGLAANGFVQALHASRA